MQILIVFVFAMSCGFASAETKLIKAEKFTVTLSDRGEIVGITLSDGIHREVCAKTVLANCRTDGKVLVEQLESGGFRFTKNLISDDRKKRCTLREQFKPAADSVRWEIEIIGTGQAWSTAIQTQLLWPTPEKASIWLAGSGGTPATRYGWNDPLQPVPFAKRQLKYGARDHMDTNAISLPLVTILESATDHGLSLILSPQDVTFDMMFSSDPDGKIVFSRSNNRIEAGHILKFAMDIVTHPADWRPGIGWMTRRYPEYFDPPNPQAHKIAGCGAYSSHTEIIDAEKLRKMAFRVNWKASFDFPYMGMFIPPMSTDTETWINFKGQPTSISMMKDYSKRMRDNGFYVLNYFNVTEFGNYITFPPPPRKAKDDIDLWKDPDDFLHYAIGDGILLNPEAKPYFSWHKCVAMDPGEPTYQNFLLEQAKRHIEKLPRSSGICIDRMDWLTFYNTHRDDGLAWYNNAPARSLITSWHDIISKLGPMMHNAEKVIFCNPHYRRLDLLRQIDGVYDEFGQYGFSMNLCAFLTVRKPLIGWTIDVPEIRDNPDTYFQRHLYMGAFLTAPVPGNDHTILPDAEIEKHYLAYGPLLNAMQGRKWLLLPHVVKAMDKGVKVNLFEVPYGYVLPVTFAADRSNTTVIIRGLTKNGKNKFRIEALHPNTKTPIKVSVEAEADTLKLNVPLIRGCAMVKLQKN